MVITGRKRGIAKLALCSLFTGGHWCCRNRLAGADMMRSFCKAASCCVICDPLQTLLQFFIRTHTMHSVHCTPLAHLGQSCKPKRLWIGKTRSIKMRTFAISFRKKLTLVSGWHLSGETVHRVDKFGGPSSASVRS